jgi:non-canonical (house-cleaning) NTP pyrophosphatase
LLGSRLAALRRRSMARVGIEAGIHLSGVWLYCNAIAIKKTPVVTLGLSSRLSDYQAVVRKSKVGVEAGRKLMAMV